MREVNKALIMIHDSSASDATNPYSGLDHGGRDAGGGQILGGGVSLPLSVHLSLSPLLSPSLDLYLDRQPRVRRCACVHDSVLAPRPCDRFKTSTRRVGASVEARKGGGAVLLSLSLSLFVSPSLSLALCLSLSLLVYPSPVYPSLSLPIPLSPFSPPPIATSIAISPFPLCLEPPLSPCPSLSRAFFPSDAFTVPGVFLVAAPRLLCSPSVAVSRHLSRN